MFSSLLPKIATFFSISFVFASFFIPTISLEAKSVKSVSKKITSYIKTTKTPKNLVKNINKIKNSQNSNLGGSNTTNSNINSPITNLVKKSKNNICHDSSSKSYAKTKIFTSFSSLESCLNSGGKLPLK